jgi:hypothetical protein
VSYRVEYARSIYGTQVVPLSAAERAEVDAHVRRLEKRPLAGGGVFRVRGAPSSLQPLFMGRTKRFSIFHTIRHDGVVVILGVISVKLRP